MSTIDKGIDRDEQAGHIMEHLSTAVGIAEDLLRDGVEGDEAQTLRRVQSDCDDLAQNVLDTFPGALGDPEDGDGSPQTPAGPMPPEGRTAAALAKDSGEDDPLIWLNVGMTQTDWNKAMRWVGITAEDRPTEAKYANRLLTALDRAARASQDYVFPSHNADDDDCETDCP